MGGFEDGGELGVLESEERVAPDRETEQHDGEHEEEEAGVSRGGGDHIRENGELLVELEELEETQEDDEGVDTQHHFELLVDGAKLFELSDVVRIIGHQVELENNDKPVEDVNEGENEGAGVKHVEEILSQMEVGHFDEVKDPSEEHHNKPY